MATTHITRDKFLDNLRASALIPLDQLDAIIPSLPTTERGRLIARALVDRGLLTRFQAELLLAGRTDGFRLGQYAILDEVAKGGMGKVYKARHITMNRVVALKVLASHLTKTPRARELFKRETQAAARLHHPNIVTAYDANEAGERLYLVMEFVDGPDLFRLVSDRGPLPIGQACEFVRQAAEGLQHAHEQGMVHRDIKPHNLLVHHGPCGPERPDGLVVKILDFGLARLGTPAEEGKADPDSIEAAENAVLGTPDFLSPEQGRNINAADIRSDIYALGCTLYFLLTGKPPFPDGSPLDKMVRHLSEEPVPLPTVRADVPAAVDAVVRRCMAKNPAARYQTPAELADALAPLTETPGAWVGVTAPRPGSLPEVELLPFVAILSDQIDVSGSAGTLQPGQTPLIPGRRPAPEPARAGRVWLLLAVPALLFLAAVTAIAFAVWQSGR